MPGSEEALANVEKRAEGKRQPPTRRPPGPTLSAGPAATPSAMRAEKEALENFLDIQDTDPAGETADETAVITGLRATTPQPDPRHTPQQEKQPMSTIEQLLEEANDLTRWPLA